MFVDMIYLRTVVIKSYSCAYVGNLCPRLDLVLRLGCLASVCLSGTLGWTSGWWSGVCWCIGAWWVSYYCNGTADCSSDDGEFYMVFQHWSDREMNVDDGSCCSEWPNIDLFPFIDPSLCCKYLGGARFTPQPLILTKEGSNATCNFDDTLPVNNLNNKATALACIVHIPKCIPGVLLLFHFSNGWSVAKVKSNAYTGQKSGWHCLGL